MPQHEGSCFGESRNGARGRGEPFLHPCLPVPALWDHGNQQLKLDCDREVRYLVSSSNGEGSLRHRDSSQDKPAGPSGVGLGGGAASGPQADSSPGRHPAHQHHKDRDLESPGTGAVIWTTGLRALICPTGTPTPQRRCEDQRLSHTLGLRAHTEPGPQRDPTVPKRRMTSE